jgi:hypothetical protein
LTYRYPESATKRNQIIFVFLVTTLVSSLSAVAFLIDNNVNLAFASKKNEASSGGGGGGGSSSSDNGGGTGSSNGGRSTDNTSTPPPPPTTEEPIAPPTQQTTPPPPTTEETTPPPPPSIQQTCPDGSTPDVNGLCPALAENSGGTTPNTSGTGSSNSTAPPTISSEDTSGNSTSGGSSSSTAPPLTSSDGTKDGSATSSGSDNNKTPQLTTPDSSSGTGSSSSTPTPANQSTSSSGSSASSSSTTTTSTKPSNSNTPQTGVSQSAANAATNQIINSPGSTIVNQQSIKQSVKINNEVNNIIRKNVISQSSSSAAPSSTTLPSSVISNLITVKLATTSTMSRNAYLPIGDVAPYHLIGGHITANLPNNHLYVVVAQLASSNGAIQHAVVLDMIKSQISNTYETDLGSQISGTNPLTGKQDIVSDITNLFLWNNGNQQVTFVDANAVTMNLIYK